MSSREQRRTDGQNFTSRFEPEALRFVDECTNRLIKLTRASKKQDMELAVDFILEDPRRLFSPGLVTIGSRVRREYAFSSWPREFTFRVSRFPGVEAELDKVILGTPRLFYYGFASTEESRIIGASLLDLNVYRQTCTTRTIAQKLGAFHENKDEDDSDFYSFNLDDFPQELVIGQFGIPAATQGRLSFS